ncbi:hypothetical protein BCR39DRAFT_588162 [Naematelia encephala]|uniref:CNH domain-containing protein n=1 Tax=Naematelia encephala TaxID=71784 RepID=A0A1Y2B4M6_9TREE|nr:hypothetical protein BCR39DRAFT_588162 [Naematelia encephala]
MASFSLHPLLSALKVRITAVHQNGDRLYLGTATGTLQIYSFDISSTSNDEPLPVIKLVKTHTLGKKPIEQIGILKESGQLAVLSDSVVTLYSLSDLGKAGGSILSQARNAHAFAITSYTPSFARRKPATDDTQVGEVRKDLLVVGCRKKVVVFGAGKGGLKEAWELNLPHSPRQVIFPSAPSSSTSSPMPETVHLLYSPTSSVLLNIIPASTQRLSVSELTSAPPPPPHPSQVSTTGGASGSKADDKAADGGTAGGGLSMGMGALQGLGGYVGLGGRAAIPVGTRTVGGEVLISREDQGVFYSSEGNFTRTESLQWPAPPEAIGYASPYIYTAVPVVQSTASSSGNLPPTSTIQIHLSPTLSHRQTISLPGPPTGALSVTSMISVSGPPTTPAQAMSAAPKALFISTPTDRNLVTAEGSSVWLVRSGDIGEQVDELVREGHLSDAIGLVEAVGDSGLAPKRRLPQLRILSALQSFAQGKYQAAIETFLIFNVNPALVIALYPSDNVSGRLHVHRDKWMELFGAVEGARLEPQEIEVKLPEDGEGTARSLLRNLPHLGVTKKPSMDVVRKESRSEDDGASIRSDGEKVPAMTDTELPRAALEALMYFLSDRRQKLAGAIAALPSPLPAESDHPPLSALPIEELHDLPSLPMSELDHEHLLRMAQVIYTALIKVYLVARPVLVGSLCRIENWCDVEEVEGLLKAQKKFADLIDLYQGKKMHGKALGMLRELAKEEDDKLDKYPPTIRYLQKLGPSELPLIFEHSKWIFQEQPTMALQIFTADEPEVESLPRTEVMQFLEQVNLNSCMAYLEHIINVLGETGAEFHDKLSELYLQASRDALKTQSDRERPAEYSRFLDFLNKSTSYRPYRLLNRLEEDQMPEARAILVGRMGNHEEALRIYVFRLKDYSAAEAYCGRLYAKEPDPHGIFLLLLRIYLLPAKPSDPVLLDPAISLIATHGVRLDANEVLALLPPLVTMEDVKAFFVRTLRDSHAKKNDHRVVKSLVSARKERVDRVLMGLQIKRVRVSDQRICPQCHKRLGQSAIAVHVPRGEVTHLHCKDLFSAKLEKLRG